MLKSKQFILFLICLMPAFGLVEWFARHSVKTTLAWQTLSRYSSERPTFAVFLGSSLTDAGIPVQQFDSTMQDMRQGLPSCNLALAGMSGSEYYYLILKNYLVGKSKPKILILEGAGIPFFPPPSSFKLEGDGERVELIQAELMTYSDFVFLSGRFPGIVSTLSFWLHKHWFSYHYRMEIQGKIHERQFRPSTAPDESHAYFGGKDFRGLFSSTAENNLARLGELSLQDVLHMQRNHFLDIAALSKEQGIRLVVVNPPCPPIDQALVNDARFQRYNQAFTAYCDSIGISYLDFSGEGKCGPYTFSDGIHLDADGARVFTHCLAEKLKTAL